MTGERPRLLKEGEGSAEEIPMTDDERRRAIEWWFRNQPADHPLIRVLFGIALERGRELRPGPRSQTER